MTTTATQVYGIPARYRGSNAVAVIEQPNDDGNGVSYIAQAFCRDEKAMSVAALDESISQMRENDPRVRVVARFNGVVDDVVRRVGHIIGETEGKPDLSHVLTA